MVGAQPNDLVCHNPLESLQIPGSKHLTSARFDVMPNVANELWDYINCYFSCSDCPHSRTYRADFECNHCEHTLTIHISVEKTR